MSAITTVVITGNNCQCEIEINMISSERSTIDPRPQFIKRSHIRKLCHAHELEARQKLFKQLKSKKIIITGMTIEELQNHLNDLSNEIPNT